MADDPVDIDVGAMTDVLSSTDIISALASDASTIALVRACPQCGLRFSADYDMCPVDGAKLSHAPKLGGSLMGNHAAAPDIDSDTDRLGGPKFDETDMFRQLEPVDDATIRGSVLDGRFFVEEMIGEGGMGRVYRGSQLSVGRPVAIKVLHKRISKDPSIRERFNREAQIISSFTHPNTVRLVDFGESDGHLYMAMEYVDGVSVQAFAGKRPMNVALTLDLMEQLCAPLAEAHKADVVHRDLKPENIFITRSADNRLQIKLLDFGVAHIDPSSAADAADTHRQLTQAGVVVGTPEYMAPEQARGEKISTATDVYALGVILYQLLSGQLPFSGGSQMHTLFELVTKPVPPITDHVPNCPKRLVELLEKLLLKDPTVRPGDVIKLGRSIRRVRKELELDNIGELPPGDLHDILSTFAYLDSAETPRSDWKPRAATTEWKPSGQRRPLQEEAPQSAPAKPSHIPTMISEQPSDGVLPAPAKLRRETAKEGTPGRATRKEERPTVEPSRPVSVPEPTLSMEIERPYIPGAPVPTVQTESQGFHVKVVVLAVVLVAVIVAIGIGLATVLDEPPPPKDPPAEDPPSETAVPAE